MTGKTFNKLTVLGPAKNIGNKTAWICKCSCGNPDNIIVQGQSLTRGLTTSCGCNKFKSLQIEKIKDILLKNNISFQEEKKIKINEQNYYFDLLVDNKYFIEFDGEQHFSYKECQGWNTKENTLKTLQRDLIKNSYCFLNNIPLIRIPYSYKNIKLKDLQLESSNFIITQKNEPDYYIPHQKIKQIYLDERKSVE